MIATSLALVHLVHLCKFSPLSSRQPPLKVFRGLGSTVSLVGGDVFAASGGAILAGRTSIRGTKEWSPCSNRGACDEREFLI